MICGVMTFYIMTSIKHIIFCACITYYALKHNGSNFMSCTKVHGKKDPATGEVIRLCIRCKECHMEHYCGRACRDAAKESHKPVCQMHQEERQERRERRVKQVSCDTCKKRSSYTKMKKCSRCRNATYCSVECQKKDWHRHKLTCQKPS